ncbi:MAG: mechanosensitive ion channel [Desulfovibrionaceae bacterium]|nr:mechanosensitive ion channel [Desulfovibrionaceae bacterium]MBF0515178.1 mechanosensitive ion channel [Desulfovibrionaceae bacterium]
MPRYPVSLLIAVLISFSFAAASPAQEPEPVWQNIFQKNLADLDLVSQDLFLLDRNLPKVVSQTRQNRLEMEKNIAALALVASFSNHNPYELKAALAAADKLTAAADSLFRPLSAFNLDAQRIDGRLGAIEQDNAKLVSENQDARLTPVLEYYREYISGLRPILRREAKLIEAELSPAEALRTELGEVAGRVNAAIPTVWRDFYLTAEPGVFSLTAWRHTAAQFRNRLGNLSTLHALIGGEESGQLADILIKLALLSAVLAGVWLAVKRRLKNRLYPERPEAARRVAVAAALGLFLAYAASSAPLLLYDLFTALAEIFLARAAAGWCWLDRTHETGGLEGKNPLTPLTNLFAAALLIHVLNPPAPLDALAFAAACWPAVRRRDEAGQAIPSPFRQCARTGRAVCAVCALAALAGWQNLAILVLTGAYLACLGVCAGFALTARLRVQETALTRQRGQIPLSWLIRAFGYPVVYLGLFLTGLYWFCARLGGREVFIDLIFRQAGAGAVSVSLWRLFMLLAGFYLARASVASARTLAHTIAKARDPADKGPADMIRAGSTYAIWGVYALVALHLLGVDLASLAVVIGGLSVGIGFGLQNVVNNFVAGLILLFGRSIQSGDVIQIGETMGTVKEVNIRNTIVQTSDNATLFVPNAELISKQLLNWTHKDLRLKREIIVHAAYGADAGLIRQILLEAAAREPHALKEPAPKVFFQNFGETTLEFSLAVWIDSVANARLALSAIRDAIYRQGEESGIPWTPSPPGEGLAAGEDALPRKG